MFSPVNFAGFGFMFFVLMIWSLFWKAWALWISARRGEKIWFGVMLVINTAGILEILYIYVFSKGKTPEIVKKVVSSATKVEAVKTETAEEPKTAETTENK